MGRRGTREGVGMSVGNTGMKVSTRTRARMRMRMREKAGGRARSHWRKVGRRVEAFAFGRERRLRVRACDWDSVHNPSAATSSQLVLPARRRPRSHRTTRQTPQGTVAKTCVISFYHLESTMQDDDSLKTTTTNVTTTTASSSPARSLHSSADCTTPPSCLASRLASTTNLTIHLAYHPDLPRVERKKNMKVRTWDSQRRKLT